MFPPAMAAELRRRGFDVLAVAEDLQLRSMSDVELCRWANENGRRIVTENVKDFRPLAAMEDAGPGLLFTSSRAFPRSRRSVGLLISSLEAWLRKRDAKSRPSQDWLQREVGPKGGL
jgi:hypothetical protein